MSLIYIYSTVIICNICLANLYMYNYIIWHLLLNNILTIYALSFFFFLEESEKKIVIINYSINIEEWRRNGEEGGRKWLAKREKAKRSQLLFNILNDNNVNEEESNINDSNNIS